MFTIITIIGLAIIGRRFAERIALDSLPLPAAVIVSQDTDQTALDVWANEGGAVPSDSDRGVFDW